MSFLELFSNGWWLWFCSRFCVEVWTVDYWSLIEFIIWFTVCSRSRSIFIQNHSVSLFIHSAAIYNFSLILFRLMALSTWLFPQEITFLPLQLQISIELWTSYTVSALWPHSIEVAKLFFWCSCGIFFCFFPLTFQILVYLTLPC